MPRKPRKEPRGNLRGSPNPTATPSSVTVWQSLLVVGLSVILGCSHLGRTHGPTVHLNVPSAETASSLENLLGDQLKTPPSRRLSVVEDVRALLAAGANCNEMEDQLSALGYALLLHDKVTALVLLQAGCDADAPVAPKGSKLLGGSAAKESAMNDILRPIHLCLLNKDLLVDASRMLLEGRTQAAPGSAALNYALDKLSTSVGAVDSNFTVKAAELRAVFAAESLPVVEAILGKLTSLEQLLRRDRWGRTALHLSALSHNIAAAEALLARWSALDPPKGSRCALLGALDSLQRTAEHVAAQRSDAAMLELLMHTADHLECSAIHQQKDVVGKLATDYANPPIKQRVSPRRVAHAEEDDSGGWDRRSTSLFDTDKTNDCDFDVVDVTEMTPRKFLLGYLTSSTPVLIRGAADGWDMRRKKTWSKAEFKRRFAATQATAAKIPYARSFGEVPRIVTLGQFIDGEGESTKETGLYVFSDRLDPQMLDDFSLQPEWAQLDGLVDPMPIAIQYYVGPAGSGAPTHFHCDGEYSSQRHRYQVC